MCIRKCSVALWSLIVVTLVAGSCVPAAALPPTAAPAAATEPPAPAASAATDTTLLGIKLPADAAPYDMQVYTEPCDIKANQVSFDVVETAYQSICFTANFQDQLVDVDRDFNLIPGSAEKWEVSEDGLIWTFHLKPGLVWSDGTPLTAYDYEASYRYEADPKHAWDLGWIYYGVLENWDDIVAGKKPVTDLGVKALDDLTLQIKTQKPWPAMAALAMYSFVMQKKALETYGPLYNSKVETSVSSGPYKLALYEPGKRIELVPNPTYKGYRPPRLKKMVAIYMDTSTGFAAFQNREIDRLPAFWLTPADLEVIQQDPTLKQNYLVSYADFRTDYLLMDTSKPPFNDLNVRKAFAHAVDREAIVKNVLTPIKGMPAYSFLMPGFPAADTEGKLKQYQNYDCNLAKDYLAKAGYPDGKDFPKLELWLRGEAPSWQAVFQAVATSIASCLNINIDVSNKDSKVYQDALLAKPTQVQFGAISYGMDYLDPSNMLGLWVSTGYHAWKNDEYDRLVREASSFTGDPAVRKQMFQDAEKILVEDVGGIFIDHRWSGDLMQPYILGDAIRKKDSAGTAGWHFGNYYSTSDIYVSKDVLNYKTYRNP